MVKFYRIHERCDITIISHFDKNRIDFVINIDDRRKRVQTEESERKDKIVR